MNGAGRRHGLGRGLDALLSSTARPSAAGDGDTAQLAGVELAVDAIDPNPEQPRRDFDATLLQDLAESIRLHGVLQPIVVERDGHGGHRLVAGERRLRAARLAGLASIPAVIRPAAESARQSLEVALVENLQRADLSPLDEASAYARLADTFGLSHDAISLRVGRSRPSVTNAIRLLQLPPEIQEHLATGRLTAGHARALLPLPAGEAVRLATRAVDEHLSVRITEQAAAIALEPRPQSTRPSRTDSALIAPGAPRTASSAGEAADQALAGGLERALGTPVRLERRRHGGRLVIDFFDDEHLDGLYTRLGGPAL